MLSNIFLFTILLGTCVAICYSYLLKKHINQLREVQTSFESIMTRLQNKLWAVSNSSYVIGQRMVKLDKDLRDVLSRQDVLEMTETEGSNYSHAAKMVRLGASVDELIYDCGLSKGEAEMVYSLYSEYSEDS